MPAAAAAVKDLLPAHPQPRHEVLEVRHRRRCAAEHGGVERAAARGEQRERGEAAADLEAPVGDVLVRYAIAGDVERRAEEQRERSRADDGWFRKLFAPSSPTGSAEDDAILREEYGENEGEPSAPGGIAGGVSGYAGLEDAEAVEGEMEATEAPQDPAP